VAYKYAEKFMNIHMNAVFVFT